MGGAVLSPPILGPWCFANLEWCEPHGRPVLFPRTGYVGAAAAAEPSFLRMIVMVAQATAPQTRGDCCGRNFLHYGRGGTRSIAATTRAARTSAWCTEGPYGRASVRPFYVP